MPLKNSTNAKPRPSGAAWISNEPTRQFMRELKGTVQLTERPNSEWLTTRSARNPQTTARLPRSDTLWDESQSQRPNYPYKETVRCRAMRQGLPCHDCPECRSFYQMLKDTGHEFSQEPLQQFGRHRARFAPSETPADFWELDFIDELNAEREKRANQSNKSGDVP